MIYFNMGDDEEIIDQINNQDFPKLFYVDNNKIQWYLF
jgi:hypothetical protein